MRASGLFRFMFPITLFLLSVSGAPCQTVALSADPAGNWESTRLGMRVLLELKPDGTGTFGGNPVHWEFGQGMLNLKGPKDEMLRYKAKLTPDSMTLSGADITVPVVFRRVQPEGTDGASTFQQGTAPDPGLYGRWQGPAGIIQINKDGTMIVREVMCRYNVQNNALVLVANNGIIVMPFQLQGDLLTVTIAGQSFEMRRIPSEDSPQGSAPADLVGK
jgi:hypothetical protein